MTFTQAIETLRDQAGSDIEYIVADYVKLKRSGSGMVGRCPFHDEKTPSFHVSGKKMIYKCFGCGAGGDVIDFIGKIEGLEFHEVIYKLADRYNINIDNNSDSSTSDKVHSDELILPGIRAIRTDIRKKSMVSVSFKGSSDSLSLDAPKINVNPPLSEKEAAVISKYSDKCCFLISGLDWPPVRDSLMAAIQQGINVYMIVPGLLGVTTMVEWIDYILPEVGGRITKKEVIKLLAAIPNDIDRSIYTTHFSDNL